MKRHTILIPLFLLVMGIHAEDQVVYTFIAPQFDGAGRTHRFRMGAEEIRTRATQEPHQPKFDLSVEKSIGSVRSFLESEFAGSFEFKVFHATIGWHSIEVADGNYRGFQFCFVRSQIRVPLPDGGSRIQPSYLLVLEDGTVIDSSGPEDLLTQAREK